TPDPSTPPLGSPRRTALAVVDGTTGLKAGFGGETGLASAVSPGGVRCARLWHPRAGRHSRYQRRGDETSVRPHSPRRAWQAKIDALLANTSWDETWQAMAGA